MSASKPATCRINAQASKGLSLTLGLSLELSPWSPESLAREKVPEIVVCEVLREDSGTSSDIADVTLCIRGSCQDPPF
jgi:hypothetical protein